MKWSPEKYWNINDSRFTILQKYLRAIPINKTELMPTEKIIEICINTLKTFSLNEEERKALKELILEQNAQILEPCIKGIREQLVKLNLPKITLISLGCGNESLFERLLDEDLRRNLSSLKIKWLGVDVGDFRDHTSFFNNHPFVTIEDRSDIKYRLLAKDDSPVVLIGRYSYHHLGIEFSEFQERCVGLTKVILVEEPTTTERWQIPEYRFMRIAYDVIANTIFVMAWAEEFIKDPSKFKVNYIKTNTLKAPIEVIEFSGVLPETALISF